MNRFGKKVILALNIFLFAGFFSCNGPGQAVPENEELSFELLCSLENNTIFIDRHFTVQADTNQNNINFSWFIDDQVTAEETSSILQTEFHSYGLHSIKAVLDNGRETAEKEISIRVIIDEHNYTMAFILLALDSDSEQIIADRIANITTIKELFASTFYKASSELATMDTSYPVALIQNGSFEGNWPREVLPQFYLDHPDDFDFITIYHHPDAVEIPLMFHYQVQNYIRGIGFNDIFEKDLTEYYGSDGRLLGFNVMAQMPETAEEIEILTQNGLLHEQGHQWGVHAGEDFRNDINADLEIMQQGIHFYIGLESPYSTGTPMGSKRWLANGNGTYRADISWPTETEFYHPFLLYFMGLYTRDNFDFSQSYRVFNAGAGNSGLPINLTAAPVHWEISLNDIIQLLGERRWFY